MSADYMREPLEISVDHTEAGNSNITHRYYKVKAADRFRLLKLLVELEPDMYAVIFCRTRREVNGVSEDLRYAGHAADALHGDMSQAQRDDVMQRFRRRRVKLLVATDVAARGLDVQDLTHVINYNLPDAPEVYVHRSGRTGRAGKEGIAFSIVTGREMRKIRDIERYGKLKFEEAPIPTQKEIYRRRAEKFALSVKEAELKDAELVELLPEISEAFTELNREELIRRFLAHGLADLTKKVGGSKRVEAPRGDREDKGKDRRRANAYTRLCMAAGKKQGYTVPQVIGMLNRLLPGRKIDLGKIDLQSNLTFIDVDSKEVKRVVAAFDGVVDKGNELQLRVYDGAPAAYTGNFKKRKKKHRKGQGK